MTIHKVRKLSGNLILAGDIIPEADNTRSIGSATKELKDIRVDGTGYIDTLDPAAGGTKEFFYPATAYVGGGAAWEIWSAWAGVKIDADGEEAVILGYVPHDFSSITSFDLVLLARDTLTPMSFRVSVQYAADDESYTANSDLNNDRTENVTNNDVVCHDISDLFAALAANDFFAIKVERVATQNTTCMILGARIRYS